MTPAQETYVPWFMSPHWVTTYMSKMTDNHEQRPIYTKRDPHKRPVYPLSWVHTESRNTCQKWPMYTKRYRYIQKETHKKDLSTLFHESTLRHDIHVKSDRCANVTDVTDKIPIYTKRNPQKGPMYPLPWVHTESRYTCQKRLIYTKIDRYIRKKIHKRDLWPSFMTLPKTSALKND